MGNKNFTKSNYDSPPNTSINASERLKTIYEQFVAESSKLFPKVDQKLLLDMIHLETSYKDS